MNNPTIITISRQYGSGGREIGRKLAQRLGIPFYDYELISLAAKESGYAEELFAHVESKTNTNSFLYSLSLVRTSRGSLAKPLNDRLFAIQSDIVHKVAAEGSCVIVGRCADYILKNDFNCLNVFIYADNPSKVRRVMQRKNISEKQAIEAVLTTDKRRATYYNYYTDGKWGKMGSYDIAINSSSSSIDNIVDILEKLAAAKSR